MKKYLLPEGGNFYKANLHCHTNFSDGWLSPAETKALYKEDGYSILAITDHNALVAHPELNEDDFLILNGLEFDLVEIFEDNVCGWDVFSSKACHINMIALEPDNLTQPCWHREKYFTCCPAYVKDLIKFNESQPDWERKPYTPEVISKIMQEARDKGFFVTYNHPAWGLDSYDDYTNYHGMHAMEIINYGSLNEGFDEHNTRIYDEILRCGQEKLFCIAADDSHCRYPREDTRRDFCGAWTQIKADKLDYRTVTKAMENGHFYASEGPEIYSLAYEDGRITMDCSEVVRVIINRDIRPSQGFHQNGKAFTHFDEQMYMTPKSKYFRITLVDAKGKCAYTNAYFFEDL